MITFKINPLGSDGVNVEFRENETLLEIANRSFREYGGTPTPEYLESVLILIDGKEIPSEMWDSLAPGKSNEVVVTIRLSGGNFGQTFKLIAITAIVIGASALLGPGFAVNSPYLYTAIMTAVSIGSSILLNALIPPLGAGNPSGAGKSYNDSQMFAISNQSNAVKRFGEVPKCYGTHRMFPYIAANPYIEYAPNDGLLEQYLVGIYDFGVGTNQVDGIRIGETQLGEFTGVSYNFVDLNKPTVTEDVYWENVLRTSFTLYNGKRSVENYSVAVDGNKDAGDPESEYRVFTHTTLQEKEVVPQ
jgi:hypothetical protein